MIHLLVSLLFSCIGAGVSLVNGAEFANVLFSYWGIGMLGFCCSVLLQLFAMGLRQNFNDVSVA